jgi:hypothetical protein
MITVGIYIKDSVTLEYNRVELFNDEKISVNSSIQNINDLSKTYTDFSQTFVVPASKQNNKIFRHWYENSNDSGFSTLIKADAYIEIDTILFRSGKIQLESCNVKDGQPQDYSITFIGALGSLKDKFNGLYLKDLDSSFYDITYSGTVVKNKIVTTTTSSDVMFPLISSSRYWNYDSTIDPTNNISNTVYPIRYNELFPALKLSSVLDMINRDSKWNINFNGTFLSDARFTNAYLYLKNAELFKANFNLLVDFASSSGSDPFTSMNYTTETLTISDTAFGQAGTMVLKMSLDFTTSGFPFDVLIYKNGLLLNTVKRTSSASTGLFTLFQFITGVGDGNYNGNYTFKIQSEEQLTFSNTVISAQFTDVFSSYSESDYYQSVTQTLSNTLPLKNYFPNIKIEDFFSGLLKMFNLTCYSTDGINYTIEQLESYYTSGQIIDVTKYIKSDNANLNRVKTYKKINFEYEKSESLVNVGFMSANGVEYGSLLYNTDNDGDEYNIKLPFEDLNFSNLQDKLQVGYALKTDLTKYIPKPIILYDYNPTALTSLTGTDFWFNTNVTGGTSTQHTSYKAFGQELLTGGVTYSLNFNIQQSTLTNEVISNSLYNQYYENYLDNIFDSKARLIKVSGILPTSLLTTLKLNDRLIIRDKRYLINTFTTDLTTGEVQFELLTDFREAV